ncbi:MAG: DUF432 domain-containing protein, partial [Thermoplasmatota archaeon]
MELPSGDVVIKEVKGSVLYTRTTPKKQIHKRIVLKGGELSLQPVEPINTPKFVTPNLMLEFKRTLVMPPRESRKIYLRFPIEMAVIAKNGKQNRIIDIFTRNTPKYTLYGDVRTGSICRYYQTVVSMKPPRTDIAFEGDVEVLIRNQTNAWAEVGKLVFLGTLMKIYYSDDLVSMKAQARILDDDTAETKFLDQPVRKEQKKAYETLTTKNLKVMAQRFVMEGGY